MLRPETLIEDLRFPEGPRWRDGRLWFSDMHSQRVLAVDLDGSMETVATVPQDPSGLGWLPDGICLDAEGAVWVASPVGGTVLRLLEGGEVTHRVEVEHEAFACMLGGPERRTLFICTAASSEPNQTAVRRGRIEWVEVPGAGLP